MKRNLLFSFPTSRQMSSHSLVENNTDTQVSPFVVPSGPSTTPSPAKRSFTIFSSPADIEARRQKHQRSILKIEVERLQAQLETERIKHEQTLSTRDGRILELEKDRKFLYETEKDLRIGLDTMKEDMTIQISGLKKELTSSKSDREQLSEKLSNVEAEKRLLTHSAMAFENQVKSIESRMAKQIELLQGEICKKDQLILAKDHLIDELRSEPSIKKPLAANSASERVSSSPPYLNDELLERLHRLEVDNRRLSYENRILTESSQARKLLEEKLHTTEQRLSFYRNIEQELNELRTKLASQSDHFSKQAPISARDMKHLLERIGEFARTQYELGELESKHKGTVIELRAVTERLAGTEKQLQESKQVIDDLTSKLLLTQGQDSILRSEIEMLKGHLEAAEKLEKTNQELLLNLTRKKPV